MSSKEKTGHKSMLGTLFEKRFLKAGSITLLAFAIGLVGFFLFAADFGDGLERTMEEGEAEESTEFEAPLSYGDDYPHAVVSGIVGFLFVLGVVIGYGKLRGIQERIDEA